MQNFEPHPRRTGVLRSRASCVMLEPLVRLGSCPSGRGVTRQVPLPDTESRWPTFPSTPGVSVMPTDKQLTCRDCGQGFLFTVGEQEFFASRGFTNEPSRCP